MRSTLRIAAPIVLLALLVTAGTIVSPVSADPGADSANGKLVMVLDSSGSMKEKDASGQTKIAAAKTALNTVVDELPEQANVGLRVYGAEVFSRNDKGACSDSQLVVPIGSANKPALKSAIAKYRPYGETPIAYSLQQAAKDLGTKGQRSIVLVSDGEATCAPDPCRVAADLAKQGIDLKIDVVGLNVSGKAQEQLRCIAENGNGTYYNADDADDLTAGLTRMSARAFRPFGVSGTPIRGTALSTDAPSMKAGQYTDALGGTGRDGSAKFYKVSRTKGSTMHLAATGRPPREGGLTVDSIRLKLSTLDGEDCGNAYNSKVDSGGSQTLLTATLVAQPETDKGTSDDCKDQTEFLLRVVRGNTDQGHLDKTGTIPVELRYTEEPPITNKSALPPPFDADDLKESVVREAKPSGDIVGGASFNDAPELEQGTVEDTIRPGELLFYKVKTDWGQSPAVTFRLKADARVSKIMGIGEGVETHAYAPDRSEIATSIMPGNRASLFTADDDETYDAVLPEVRYNNREGNATSEAPSAQAGYYYFAIQLKKGTGAEHYNWQVPMTISTKVNGQRQGAPEYAGLRSDAPSTGGDRSGGTGGTDTDAGGDAGAGAASNSAEGGSILPLALGLAAVAIGLVGAILWLVARRSRR